MKFFLVVLLLCSIGQAGETSLTTKFGNGTLTRRSDGATIITQRFGQGTISRETFRSGRKATHISQPFGRGTITRSSGYLRKSPWNGQIHSGESLIFSIFWLLSLSKGSKHLLRDHLFISVLSIFLGWECCISMFRPSKNDEAGEYRRIRS